MVPRCLLLCPAGGDLSSVSALSVPAAPAARVAAGTPSGSASGPCPRSDGVRPWPPPLVAGAVVGVTKQFPPSEPKENAREHRLAHRPAHLRPHRPPRRRPHSAAFRLAVPRNGSDTADFVDIVTFDALAKTVADHLTKGRRVAVIGRLRQSSWTTEDGSKRSKMSVVADGVIYLDAKPKASAPADDEGEAPDWPARRTGRKPA